VRPLYEAKHNRAAQERVMRKLLALKGRGWKLEMTERGLFYDALLHNNYDDSRIYEVKVRHYAFKGSVIEIGGYMVSAVKVAKIAKFANGGRWGIVVDCFDGVFVATFHGKLPLDARLDWGGRRDRGDPFDREKCYYIPARHFKRVCDTVNHAKPEGDMFGEQT
jgi:hypothetical protein